MVAHKFCEAKDLALTWAFDQNKKKKEEEEEETEEEEKEK